MTLAADAVVLDMAVDEIDTAGIQLLLLLRREPCRPPAGDRRLQPGRAGRVGPAAAA
jgi:hypothetical protein